MSRDEFSGIDEKSYRDGFCDGLLTAKAYVEVSRESLDSGSPMRKLLQSILDGINERLAVYGHKDDGDG